MISPYFCSFSCLIHFSLSSFSVLCSVMFFSLLLFTFSFSSPLLPSFIAFFCSYCPFHPVLYATKISFICFFSVFFPFSCLISILFLVRSVFFLFCFFFQPEFDFLLPLKHFHRSQLHFPPSFTFVTNFDLFFLSLFLFLPSFSSTVLT